VALSATVVAATAGPGRATDSNGTGWAVAAVRFETVGGGEEGLTVAGAGSYRGAVEVRRNGRALAVVNHVGFEDYVRGIEEVPPSWPAAALQAQAIAARTYAAHKVASGDAPWRAVGADICATPRCQVYRGLDAERKARGHGWLHAVETTAGRVLLSGGRPILASYSATAEGPLAMSQNGALEMAHAGRTAGEILSAYYGGLRPAQASARLPDTIRVALSTAAQSVRIRAAGPVRVVDAAGAELAGSAVPGEWRVVAEADGVRLVPPEAHHGISSETGPTAATATEAALVVRRPGRIVTAAAPSPGPVRGVTTTAASVLLLGAALAAITLRRRPAA
jgi:hypothetical protein